ncbi:CinA family nicotinamide mononucleotide deamidase-related protein [Atopococcus tabaci]|uniref:CinA family nicotinamide mononucleotide deamidase-related protein n=1 Tax=Atopococcus tabaci TaxID=269774 RepID=UPI002409C292|nr:CinA family nicotinamide mononucleotide deamidase-related protein [Atopococcus tabaci]
MKAEIISVGTELLMGYVVDTNATTIAQELLDIGIGTYYRQIIGDNPERMREAVEIAAERSDLVVLTGGLGPTKDDITKHVVAEIVGDELVEDPEQLKKIVDYFKNRGDDLPDNIYRQALTFKNGLTFLNEVGLACGSAYEVERPGDVPQHFVLLPGPPFEMTHMLKNYVKPYIQSKVQTDGVIESLYMNLYGIGESKVADQLDELIENQTNPTIAVYAKPRQVTIRLTANAADTESARKLNLELAETILEDFSPYFIGYGEEQTIEHFVVERLKKEEATLSVVEGFTSGKVMESLAAVSGVSSVFAGGVIALNEQATSRLFELEDTEYKIGEALAVRLAEQCAEQCGTELGLSVIGDLTANEDKHLASGTAYIGLARKGKATQVKTYPLNERPLAVLRLIAKNEALAFVKDMLG